jgi:hypothetical protein
MFFLMVRIAEIYRIIIKNKYFVLIAIYPISILIFIRKSVFIFISNFIQFLFRI